MLVLLGRFALRVNQCAARDYQIVHTVALDRSPDDVYHVIELKIALLVLIKPSEPGIEYCTSQHVRALISGQR